MLVHIEAGFGQKLAGQRKSYRTPMVVSLTSAARTREHDHGPERMMHEGALPEATQNAAMFSSFHCSPVPPRFQHLKHLLWFEMLGNCASGFKRQALDQSGG